MALGTREMLLVIRARDEASRVLGKLSGNMKDLDKGALQAARNSMARGGALVSLGAGITAMGAAGLSYFNDATNAAGEYETQARRALTQADGVKVSLNDLKKLGRQVAKEIPAAFEEMQPALYTIFSTIDTNLPGAGRLLRQFSKAAVAGQTDVNTATEGGLQAMNAFGLGVKGVTRVNDVMFQLVRKGVGTYEEFVRSLGKAGPSAKRSGQDIETLAGMMAFLTRNGLSTSMAATSASRAFDLISNSKVDKRLQDFGVAVRDANGEFRPMGDIITDLGNKMKDFTAPERAAALEKLFKGSGNNVQARRFFDLAIPGFQQLNSLTGSMRNSAGAMDHAYKIMFDSPQAKVQALTNKYEAMKTEIGDQLLPMKLKLLQALSKLLDWWDKLPGPVKKGIVILGAVAAVLATLVGVITLVAGAMLILDGALGLFELELAPLLIPIALVIAALIAIGVAVWAVIHYWDDIVAATKTAWAWIVKTFHTAVDAVVNFFTSMKDHVVNGAIALWDWVTKKFHEGVNAVTEFFRMLWNDIKAIWTGITNWVSAAASTVGNFLSELPGKILRFFEALPNRIAYLVGFILGTIIKAVVGFGIEVIRGAEIVVQWFRELPGKILIWTVKLANQVVAWARTTGTDLVNSFVNKVEEVIWWFKALPGRILIFLVELGTNLLAWAITTGTNFVNAIVQKAGEFVAWIQGLPARIGNYLNDLAVSFLTWGVKFLINMRDGAAQGGNSLIAWFKALPGNILSFFVNGGVWLFSVGGDLIRGFGNGIANAWNAFWGWVKGLFNSFVQGIKDGLGIHSPSTIFADIGNMIMQGLTNGLRAAWGMVWGFATSLPGKLIGVFSAAGSWLYSAGSDLLSGLWNGISNAAGWLKSKVLNWAGSLVDGVKNFLGIKSPSKVFAQLGMYTMHGFARGLDTGAVSAVKAAVAAANSVSDAFNSNVGLQDPSFSAYANGYINPGVGSNGPVVPSPTGASSVSSPIIPISIFTNEINPLQHAAELGDALANRVG